MTSPAGKPATIAQKARRKISLPWFRQSSVTPPHATLARQHTIDTPGSFQARLLRRQPSLSQVFFLFRLPSFSHLFLSSYPLPPSTHPLLPSFPPHLPPTPFLSLFLSFVLSHFLLFLFFVDFFSFFFFFLSFVLSVTIPSAASRLCA